MQRARRLVAVASVAVGLVALTGCRAEPGVAAYVGDRKISEDSVTRIIDELKEKTPEQAGQVAGGQAGVTPNLPGRDDVVTLLVLGDLCQRLSADKGYRAQQQVAPEQEAEQLQLPADSTFVKRKAQLDSCLTGLPVDLSAKPSDEEFTDVIAQAHKAGLPEVSREEAIAQLDGQQLRTALATKRAFNEALESYDVTVNPRYRPLDFQVLSFRGGTAAVGLRLGEENGNPVVDLAVDTPGAPA